jgi:hypothetical protein
MSYPTNASPNVSPDPQPESIPAVVETVVTTSEKQSDRPTTHTMEGSKKGRGAVIGLLVIPPLLFLVIAAAYFVYAVATMNAHQEGPQRPRDSNMASPSGKP